MSRHLGLEKLTDGHVLALACTAQVDSARRAAQVCALHRHQRDLVGEREPPALPVHRHVCGRCTAAA